MLYVYSMETDYDHIANILNYNFIPMIILCTTLQKL